jgi:hypothetical protein
MAGNLTNDDYDGIARAIKTALGGGGSSFSGGGQPSSGGGISAPTSLDTSSSSKFNESLKKATSDGVDGFGKAVSNSTGTLGELSKRGQNFSNDLVGMNTAAAHSRVGLNDFAGVIADNSKGLAGLGGSVTRGAEAFGKLSKGFYDSTMTHELQQMGYSAKDLNQVLAIQASTQRSTLGNDEKSRRLAYTSAADLAKEMDLISKLTGKNREEQMEEAKKRAADGQVEAKLRLIGIEQGADAEAAARAAFQKQFAEAEARGQGQMAKELFATGTVTSQEAATQFALTGEAAQKLAEQMDYLGKGNIAAAEAASKEADAANAKNQRDPTLLRLATLGSAAGDAGMIMKKNVEDNMAVHDSVMAYAKANGIALNSVKDFGKALDGIRTDLKASQEGRKQVGNDVAKKDGKYEDVSGLNKGVVATRIAGQEVGSGVAQAVEAKDKNGRSIAGDLNQGGRAVESAIGGLTSPGQSLGRKIGEAAEAGAASGGKEGGAIGGATALTIGTFNKATDVFSGAVTTFVREVKNFSFGAPKSPSATPEVPAHGAGGIIKGPELSVIAEKGPEAVIPLDQLPGMLGSKSSVSSSSPGYGIQGQMGQMSVGMDRSMLKTDDQKKVFDEIMTLNNKSSQEKLASLKAEQTAAHAANRASSDAIDAMEEKLEAEGKGFKDLTGAQKEEYDALRKQQRESYDASDKGREAIKAAERAIEAKQNLEALGYKQTFADEEEKAKIVEESSNKIKADIAEALPVKTIEEGAEKTKTVLTANQETTLKYAYQDAEGKKLQLENQKNLIKGELASIEDKTKQIEEIQKDADGRELTQREKNRIEKVQKEIEAGKETLKIREDDLEVYQNLDKLSAERGLKEKQETAKKEAEIKNQEMLDKIKADVAAGSSQELTVNGKSVDPNSEEGKAAMANMNAAKEDMMKNMPNPADLMAGGGTVKINGQAVDPNSEEGKAAMANMNAAKADMMKNMPNPADLMAGGGTVKINGKEIDPNSPEAKAAMKGMTDQLKQVLPDANLLKTASLGKPGESAQAQAAAKDPNQMTTEELIARDSKNIQNRTAKVDLNALQLPGFGPQMKFSASGAAAEAKKKEESKQAEEKKKAEEAKKKEEDANGEKSSDSKTAGPGTKSATLDDVVKKLDALNSSMHKLIDTHVTVGKQQVSAVKSNSGNMYDKAG